VVGGGRGAGVIRLLAPAGALAAGSVVALDEDESRHLTVRRAEPGREVQLVDGAGTRATGQLSRGNANAWSVTIGEVYREPRPVPVTLAVGAGDRDRFGLLVEQATQLGVTRVVPLLTEHTAGVSTRLREGHLDRLRRRAREALKQCGAAWAPEIADPQDLATFLSDLPAGARWLADPDGGSRPGLDPAVPLTVAVGPEGGFTIAEQRALRGAGFLLVRLGRHLLRFETAALAALTAAWLSREESMNG
jgi:16S rRNA (uracil1498-N3)-methyltransferase